MAGEDVFGSAMPGQVVEQQRILQVCVGDPGAHSITGPLPSTPSTPVAARSNRATNPPRARATRLEDAHDQTKCSVNCGSIRSACKSSQMLRSGAATAAATMRLTRDVLVDDRPVSAPRTGGRGLLSDRVSQGNVTLKSRGFGAGAVPFTKIAIAIFVAAGFGKHCVQPQQRKLVEQEARLGRCCR